MSQWHTPHVQGIFCLSGDKNKIKKPFWRYREEDVHVHSYPIYGWSVKWRKTVKKMGGNILVGNFPGGNLHFSTQSTFINFVFRTRIGICSAF